jgi:X-Pro dipeptidyl-peptidase
MHVPIGLRRACWLAVALMASMAVTHTAASVPVRAAAPTVPQVAAPPVVRDAWVVVPGLDSDADGADDRVHIQYHVPRHRRPVPVVLEASPYLAGFNAVANYDVDVPLHVPYGGGQERYSSPYEALLRPHGYAYVYAESIGSGSSTGCPTSGGPEETAAMVAVVRWLTGDGVAHDDEGAPVEATWSTGRVGMIGVSYNGTLPNAVASTGVRGLDAIVPVSAISSWYDYYRSQGAVRAPGGYQGEDADVLARFVLTRDEPRRCRPAIRSLTREQDRLTGDYNRFWRTRNYRSQAHRVEAAVLSLHGLTDWNVMSDQTGRWLRALDRHGVPTQAWWHEDGHGDPLIFDDTRWRRLLVTWFDRWLKDERNGVMGRPGSVVATGAGYRTSASWPAPAASPVWLKPAGDGRESGSLRRGGRAPGRQVLVDQPALSMEDMVARRRSIHRLLYRTGELTRPVSLSGLASVRLRASFDRPASNVSVALIQITGRGARVLSEGWMDPQNVAGSRLRGKALVPGRRYDLRIALDMALAHRIRAGHRLALVLAASDHDFTLRPRAGTRVTVSLGSTSLRLPVVGGPAAWTEARR